MLRVSGRRPADWLCFSTPETGLFSHNPFSVQCLRQSLLREIGFVFSISIHRRARRDRWGFEIDFNIRYSLFDTRYSTAVCLFSTFYFYLSSCPLSFARRRCASIIKPTCTFWTKIYKIEGTVLAVSPYARTNRRIFKLFHFCPELPALLTEYPRIVYLC